MSYSVCQMQIISEEAHKNFIKNGIPEKDLLKNRCGLYSLQATAN